LIHAVGEGLNIVGTWSGSSVGRNLGIGVIEVVVWLGVGIGWLLRLLVVGLGGRTAAKHAADGVADGGTDCNATVMGKDLLAIMNRFHAGRHSILYAEQKRRTWATHAAVLAI
jgi:hypothetical protein